MELKARLAVLIVLPALFHVPAAPQEVPVPFLVAQEVLADSPAFKIGLRVDDRLALHPVETWRTSAAITSE